jgi:hypothetical protein
VRGCPTAHWIVPAPASTDRGTAVSLQSESRNPSQVSPPGDDLGPRAGEPPCDERGSQRLRVSIFGSTVLQTPDRETHVPGVDFSPAFADFNQAPIPRFGQAGASGHRSTLSRA